MNKKLNTLLFLLVATIFNILMMLVLLLGLLYLTSKLFLTPDSNSTLLTTITLTSVMLSVAGSYFLYSKVVKVINNKWNLEKWIEPIFKRKKYK